MTWYESKVLKCSLYIYGCIELLGLNMILKKNCASKFISVTSYLPKNYQGWLTAVLNKWIQDENTLISMKVRMIDDFFFLPVPREWLTLSIKIKHNK